MTGNRLKMLVALMASIVMTGSTVDAVTPWAPMPTTPAFVTLIEVVRENNASQPKILWLRPGDKDGRTLLSFEKDSPTKSRCTAECARQFT